MANKLSVIFFLFALVLIPTRSFAQIVPIQDGFELDGNAEASSAPGDDWDLIFNNTSSAQVTTGIVDDLSGNSDNIFTIGSKDQDNVSDWHWTIQSVSDKDEILHAGAALYDGTKIYFFGDRFAVNGDAQIGFWLFKNAVSTNPDGTFNGTHAIGDILLLSNFSNGGGVVTIVAYKWVGSGGSHGTLNLIPVNGNLFAITNSSATPSPWPYAPKQGAAGTFPIGAFFEGGIDLAGLGIGIDPCFTSFLMETRSSTSITAELKDFVFGSFFTKPQVTVKSAAICIGNSAVLTASVQGGSGAPTHSFSINGGAFVESGVFSNKPAGTYTITVKDANACTATKTISIAEPPILTLTVTPTHVLCNGLSTGVITASSGGGVPTHSFSINGGAFVESGVFNNKLVGTYTITVKDANNCPKETTVIVTQPTELISSIAGIVDVLCNGGNNGSIDLNVSGGTPPYSYLWSNGQTTPDISGLVDGSYSVVVTDSHSCTTTANATISQPAVLLASIANKADVLCFGGSNGSIDLNVFGGSPTYTYQWSNGATTQDISRLVAGSYSLIVTDSHSCTTTAKATINQPPAVSCLLVAPDPLPVCGSTGNPITATVANATSYLWSVIGGNGWAITAGQGTPSIIYSAGQDSAIFKLVVTNSNGCKDSCRVTVKIGTCVKVKVFCSLTQGFWGNSNGVACATGERSADLVYRLLGAPFGNLVIGKPGRSLTITQAKSTCVTLRMPGGGPAAVLPATDQSFGANCATTIPLNPNGRFNNTLLGQTIALGLNLRLDTDLGAVLLTSTTFTTFGAKPGVDGLCGTDDDVIDYSSVLTKSIPQSVLTALNSLYSSPTVANLFDLANRALGGQSIGGATLRDMTGATGAINEGFDHCRFLQVNSSSAIGSGLLNSDVHQEIVMKAFPNPFANSTTIEFMAKTDGNVNVNVYTLTGVRVAELFNGPVKAEESNQVIFSGANLPNGIYIYKIVVDDKIYFDKLILQK